MQDYIDFAAKNGVVLLDDGGCQFCGANTQRGVHECLEIANVGFSLVDYSMAENHQYRFFTVDAHALQHPEIHGRWSNHFHLTRLQLVLKYNVPWTYQLSPQLSDYLNKYKASRKEEYFQPPKAMHRGNVTTVEVRQANDTEECKRLIESWAKEVYQQWQHYHHVVDRIAKGFLS